MVHLQTQNWRRIDIQYVYIYIYVCVDLYEYMCARFCCSYSSLLLQNVKNMIIFIPTNAKTTFMQWNSSKIHCIPTFDVYIPIFVNLYSRSTIHRYSVLCHIKFWPSLIRRTFPEVPAVIWDELAQKWWYEYTIPLGWLVGWLVNHGKSMGKPSENGDVYGKSPFLMGKSTMSMAIFYVANCKRLPEGTSWMFFFSDVTVRQCIGNVINHPYVGGIYHPFMAKMGMVYYCFTNINIDTLTTYHH